VAARDESRGVIDSVTDEEILEAYKMMAGKEGVFGEPASAAPLAGLLKHLRQGKSYKGKSIVCIVTGNGLKDPDIPTRFVGPFPELPAEITAIEKHLGLK
jgi:threonine synthase